VIKVVRIIARMNVGGPARHCLILGEGLRRHGFETVLLTGDLDEGEVSLEADPGFRVVHVPFLGRPPAPLADLRALGAMVSILRRERPDIVHTHTAKAGALGRLAARIAGVPVVVHSFHGHVLSGYFGPVGSTAVTWAERALSHLTSRIVTLSPQLRDELAGRYRVAGRDRFQVVPLGRDLEPFQEARRGTLRASLGLDDEDVLLGCVGRLVPIKNVPLLVRSFAAAARSHPRLHLVIVGDGTERSAVQAAVDPELSHRVHLLGWRQDLPEIYADLDLLALSSNNEGTPLAIIEAFAAGVPVVATAVGGVPDMFVGEGPALKDPVAVGVRLRPQGALVPPGDAFALTAAIEHFASSPARLARASAAAASAAEAYRSEHLVERMAELYRELLAQ
jgi:glycosyltransferase involved in cell wall biosynthesis